MNLSFGLFLAPLAAEFGASRAAVSLAATTNLLLFGLTQPFFGWLIDGVGPRRILLVGVALMSLGALGMSQATALWQVDLAYGVLAGAGVTGAGILTIAVLVLRWFPARQGTALTVIATGSSLGQAVFYQVTAWLIAAHGWRATCAAFGILLAGLLPVCLWLVRDGPSVRAHPAAPAPPPAATRAIVRGRTFRLLAGAYLGCGFTDFMVTTHLAVLAVDRGLGVATGARALSLLAVANVAGLLAASRLTHRLGTRRSLVVVYLVRAGALTLLWTAADVASFHVFAAAFGLTFFTTAPLMSALIREHYGLAHTGRAFGLASAVHHLAGAAGAWLAGASFDLAGSYLPVFVLGTALVWGATWLTWRLPPAGPAR